MSTPRTWTLTLDHGSGLIEQIPDVQGCRDGERVKVIELEPILDLLERAEDWLPLSDAEARELDADITAFLCAHGRLQTDNNEGGPDA